MSRQVLVYRGEARHATGVLQAIEPAQVRVQALWEGPPSLERGGPLAVLVIPSLTDLGQREELRDLFHRHPLSRRALVPELTAEAVRLVHGLPLPRTVATIWDTELPSKLRQWIERGGIEPWEEVRSLLEARAAGVPLLERACTMVFSSEPPPASVVELAKELHVTPGTLHYYWGAAIGKPSMKRVLEWNLLAFALRLRPSGLDWLRISRTLGIHPRTLDRTSNRLLGIPLKGMEQRDDHLRRSLREWVEGWAGPNVA